MQEEDKMQTIAEERLEVLRAAKRVELVHADGVWTATVEVTTSSGMQRVVTWTAETDTDAIQTALYVAHLWLDAYGAARPLPPRSTAPDKAEPPARQERPTEADTAPRSDRRPSGPITVETVAERRFPFGRQQRMQDMTDEQLAKAEAWLREGPGRHEDERKRQQAFVLLSTERKRRAQEVQR